MVTESRRRIASGDLLRCFDLRIIAQALVVALALIGLALLGKQFPAASAARIGIGVAETVVFGYLVAITLMPLSRLDELHQRIHLIAIALAFGLVGVVGTGAEFLSRAGVPMPRLGLWLWLLMVLAWGLGAAIISRRYR